MAYVSLDEAVQIVERRTGVDITVPQLIRLAAMGRLMLCVLLNCRCYSPSTRARNESADLAKHGRLTDFDASGKTAVEAATVEAYGLFILPPRHAFDFQTDDEVLVSWVSSLDGKDTFCPSVRRRRDQLQAFLPHIETLISSINESKGQPDEKVAPIEAPKPVQRSAAQDAAVLEAIRQTGAEPTELPPYARGKSGIKKVIRDAVEANCKKLFPCGGSVFDKTWERLLKAGDIAYRA